MWKVALSVAIFLSAAVYPTAQTDSPCSRSDSGFGICPVPTGGGGSASINGTQTTPGTDSDDTKPGTDSGPQPDNDGGASGGGPADPTAITDTLGTCQSDHCGNNNTPTITLTDLASFTPTTPTIHLEPNGWALLNKPTNAIADTTTHTHNGTLLGHPITVRFTPTTYHWNWGDNTHDTFTTPGTTWNTLNLPRFSPTATSHTYTERGPITITLTIDYTVDYQLDNTTWTTVTGTVTATTTVNTLVVTAKTVNVPDDCTTTPTAPGC